MRRMSVSSQDDEFLSDGEDDNEEIEDDMEEMEDDMEEAEDDLGSGLVDDMEEDLESDTQKRAKEFMSALRKDTR